MHQFLPNHCKEKGIPHRFPEDLLKIGRFILSVILLFFSLNAYSQDSNLPKLIEDLRNRNWQVRGNAADALGASGDVRAVRPLISVLKDVDERVRQKATEALVRIGPSAVGPLVAALKDYDGRVREQVVGVLGKIDDLRGNDALIAALKDIDWYVRLSAAKALGNKADARSIKPLVNTLKDMEPSVRGTAAEALGKRGDSRAVQPLIQALGDKDEGVRKRVADALVTIGPPAVERLTAALKDKDLDIKKGAVWVLGKIRDPRAMGALILALDDPIPSIDSLAREALVEIGPPAVPAMIDALKNKRKYTRIYAAEILAGIKDPRAIEPLTAALRDEDYDVRKKAVKALAVFQDARAVQSLVSTLNDKDPDYREWVIETLTGFGNFAVDSLLFALRNSDRFVRGSAAEALGKIKDARAVGALIDALTDKDADIQMISAFALGEIGDQRATGPLIVASVDGNLGVREEAFKALEKTDINWQKSVAAKEAFPKLNAALQDESPSVRTRASRMLGRMKERRAVASLGAVLDDEDQEVRRSAAMALGEIKDNGAVKPLIAALRRWSGEEKNIAAEALYKIGDSLAFPSIRNAFEDEVRQWIGRKDGASLRKYWAPTLVVLLKDVESSDYRTIENALLAFIGIGIEEGVSVLIQKLNTAGNKTMAEAYLNCGHGELEEAAAQWAKRHGYTIIHTFGSPNIRWRSW